MIKITFPDGSIREYEKGTTGMQIAESISPALARNIIACSVNGETTLTAVYEDAPAAKKGLSGGQIAGIVIGSVLLAGIGGFAVLWFAVKKKSFADLIAAIKALFTKKK